MLRCVPTVVACRKTAGAAVAVSALLLTAGCGHFGYSSRVLWRVVSPDGRTTVVCQEVPMFDGPGYAVRLENADGRLVRQLYRSYEADGCDEVVWAADGGRLAVVTRHVGRLRVVDVAWAVQNPDVADHQRFVSVTNFSSPAELKQAWNVRFTATHAELSVCPYSWEEYRQARTFRCMSEAATERVGLWEESSP